jgi:flagellar hook assembly protein FlgD
VATLTIFDIRGREIRKLIAMEARAAGVHSVLWDGKDHAGSPEASGIYLYRIAIQPQGGREAAIMLTRKMLLIK